MFSVDSYCPVEHRYNESFYIEQLLYATTNEIFTAVFTGPQYNISYYANNEK